MQEDGLLAGDAEEGARMSCAVLGQKKHIVPIDSLEIDLGLDSSPR